jgi:hypothetical protein
MSEINKSGYTKVFRTSFLTTPLTKHQLKNLTYDITHSVVNNNLVLGQSKTNHTIPDDTLVFPPIPTYHLKTLDSSADNLMDKNIFDHSGNTVYDTQLISTSIRVNRFPTKSFKQDNVKLIKRRQIDEKSDNETSYQSITKKRTDLVKFIYRNKETKRPREGGLKSNKTIKDFATIEIGAMAPTSVKQKNGFSSKFSPFSFCVTIDLKDDMKRSFSIYTDYKFKLGELYNVELVIESATSYGYGQTKYTNFLFDRKRLLDSQFVESLNNGNIPPRDLVTHSYRKKISLFRINNSSLTEITPTVDFNFENFSQIAGQNNITFDNPDFEVTDYFAIPCYVLKLYVNGVQEKVATYDGKVWGKHKTARDVGDIATMPGFKSDYMFVTLKNENEKKIGTLEDYLPNASDVENPIGGAEDPGVIPLECIKVVREKVIESYDEGIFHVNQLFDFTKLDEIQCSPILKRGFKTKKINNKDIVSLNNGVDFGLINIYKKGYERPEEQ